MTAVIGGVAHFVYNWSRIVWNGTTAADSKTIGCRLGRERERERARERELSLIHIWSSLDYIRGNFIIYN